MVLVLGLAMVKTLFRSKCDTASDDRVGANAIFEKKGRTPSTLLIPGTFLELSTVYPRLWSRSTVYSTV